MTTKEQREKAIEKIKLMSEITESNAAFFGEISAASGRIQVLMDKYHIEWAEIYASQENDNSDVFASVDADTVICRTVAWHWGLADVIARMTHTKHFRGGRYSENGVEKSADIYNPNYKNSNKRKRVNFFKTFGFYGEENSAKLAAGLFQKWLARIDIASLTETQKEKRKGMVNNARVYRNSFLDGCIEAMMSKVLASENERKEEMSTALMVVDDKVNDAYVDFSKNFGSINIGGNKKYSAAGYQHGKRYGVAINPMAKEIEQ